MPAEYIAGPGGTYIGRILGLGVTEQGNPAAVYGLSGRSEASRQRRLVESDYLLGPEVLVEPAGEITPQQKGKKSLLFYPAIRCLNRKRSPTRSRSFAVVSNGAHTNELFGSVLNYYGPYFPLLDRGKDVMHIWGCEPDDYNTPRIAGLIGSDSLITQGFFWVAKRKNTYKASKNFLNIEKGTAYCVQTYSGNPERPKPVMFKEGSIARDADITTCVNIRGKRPKDIAGWFFDSIDPRYVVAAAAAVNNNGMWRIAVRNSLE